MIYVVDKANDKVLFRIDAWISDCITKAGEFIVENGLKVLEQEITLMGDMVIWVK